VLVCLRGQILRGTAILERQHSGAWLFHFVDMPAVENEENGL